MRGELVNGERIRVRELSAWGLDDYEYRPRNLGPDHASECRGVHAKRAVWQRDKVLLDQESAALKQEFSALAKRRALRAEMKGLEWSLGVVDLQRLIAFQRRLFLSHDQVWTPSALKPNWDALLPLCFGDQRSVMCDQIPETSGQTLVLRSSNPNLHFRLTGDSAKPVMVHAGSSFFEVACFRDRWFLRDGYHRAYAFLQAGISEVPAVIVQARTFEELGAAQPWFFSEEILFSDDPPRITDFLDEQFTIEYERPRLIKTLRITMEETLAPASPTGGEEI